MIEVTFSMLFFWYKQKHLASLWLLCTTLAPQDSIVGLQLWKLVGLLVAVIPGKALLPFRLQGQCCIASGVAVRILEVVASPVRRSGPVRILETTAIHGLSCANCE